MHILSNELEKAKNRTLLSIRFLILGFISCLIVLIDLRLFAYNLKDKKTVEKLKSFKKIKN